MRVAFVHPDLGVGGAERLVVDAAVGLQALGHEVVMFTSHHDPSHCFEETRDGTLKVISHGDWLPRHAFGGLHILFAVLRSLWLALAIAVRRLTSRGPCDGRFDVLFVDQLSAPVPFLRATVAPVFFYGHFPDQRLVTRVATGRAGRLASRIYRAPFDALERWTTAAADAIVANSGFTARVFRETFGRSFPRPAVLYPGINFGKYEPEPFRVDKGKSPAASPSAEDGLPPMSPGEVLFVSINRFERKKNLPVAIRAFARALRDLRARPGGASVASLCHLAVAGGYDLRVAENVEHLVELQNLARELGVASAITFVPSFSEKQRSELLRRCRAVVYTPENEHFGLVPIEAMYSRRPVVAANSGGPLETVLDGETGFLVEPTAAGFARALVEIAEAPQERVRELGDRAHSHAADNFSLDAFSSRLDTMLQRVAAGQPATDASASAAKSKGQASSSARARRRTRSRSQERSADQASASTAASRRSSTRQRSSSRKR